MGLKEAIDAARLCAAKISNEAERLAMTAALNVVQNASRSDSGKPHRRTPRGWRRQEDVAADFSKQTKKIGGKSYGGVTVERVKDWERRFPNETKREPKSGYHAGLRNTANPTPEIKRDYFNAAAIEFDAMPLALQFAFWRGLLTKSPLAPKVTSIVYSGGKSLHGLLHVGCRTLADWQIVRGKLRGLLAADPDPAFRADEQAMRPRTGTRLPGVRRFSNGKTQRLLYLNPEAVRNAAKKPPNVVLILHGLLNGKSLVEIGRLTADTKQTVCARLKVAMRQFPWLGHFYRMGKRGGWTFAGYAATAADKHLTARQ